MKTRTTATEIGLQPDMRRAAIQNRARLEKAFEVGKVVELPARTFYIDRGLQSGLISGGGIVGDGGHAPPIGDGEAGAIPRLVITNPASAAYILRVRNAGFTCRGVHLHGRETPGNIHSGTGPKPAAGIQFEGRKDNPTIGLTIAEMGITDCDTAIQCLAGYYENGLFVPDENHADTMHVSQTSIFNCRVGVQSLNQQAVWNRFDGLALCRGDDNLECVFDVTRGGLWTGDNIRVGAWDTTFLNVRDFSPNNSHFDFRGVYRDGGQAGRFTLVEKEGPGQDWMDWDISISGSIANEDATPHMTEPWRLNGISADKINVRMNNLEHVPGGVK